MRDIDQLERKIIIRRGQAVKKRTRFYTGEVRRGRKIITGSLWDNSGLLSIALPASLKGENLEPVNIVEHGRMPWIQIENPIESCPIYIVAYDADSRTIENQFCYPF